MVLNIRISRPDFGFIRKVHYLLSKLSLSGSLRMHEYVLQQSCIINHPRDSKYSYVSTCYVYPCNNYSA